MSCNVLIVYLNYISYKSASFEENSGKITLGPLKEYNNKKITTRYQLAKNRVKVQPMESDTMGATCSDIAFNVDVTQLLRVEDEGNILSFYQNDKKVGQMQLYQTSDYIFGHRLQISDDDECCILQ